MSARGLEQELGDLYISEPGDAQRPPTGYTSHPRLGPSPFKNDHGHVSYNQGLYDPLPPHPHYRRPPSHSHGPPTPRHVPHPGHTSSGQRALRYGAALPPHTVQRPYYGHPEPNMRLHQRTSPNHPQGRTSYASPPVAVGSGRGTRPPKVLLRLRLKGGGGGTVLNISDINTREGLPSFKPVVYKNPADDEEESEEEEDDYRGGTDNGAARVSQTQCYYGQPVPGVPTYSASSSQPVSLHQTSHSEQVRLHRIPVQHLSSQLNSNNTHNRFTPLQQTVSSTRYAPNTSQSGAVYSGVASSAPVGHRPPPPGPHHQEENDYVNASAIANLTNDYYNEEEEEEYIPPAVPTQLSYGSVSASPHTPHIKGPDYRIAPDVRPELRPPYINSSMSPSPSFQGYEQGQPSRPPMPEPVSSKLMYTAPVAPAGRGFVQSHHKDAALPPSGMPPPPTYDQPAYSKKDGPMSYSASYSSPGQGSVGGGLYNYSDHHQGPVSHAGVEGGGGGEKQPEEEVDALTQMLMQNMEAAADPDFFGMCARCGRSIMGENTGCSALDQRYHIDCFTCTSCGQCLGGQPFFAMEGKPYCEPCYMNTLEKCSICSKPITDRILRATGKPYHPSCFTCVVCGKSLDGVPFTVDATNQIHCIEDFHKKFAPRCCVCADPIMPEAGNEETVRIVAMDRSFHVKCYKCEDCGLLLSSEAEGRGCYPLDDHILCKNCNASRIQTLTTKMTTEL